MSEAATQEEAAVEEGNHTPQQPSELRILTVEEILAAPDIHDEEVDCPEWGGKVVVRGFTKAKQQQLRREAVDDEGELDMEKMEMLIFTNGVVEPPLNAEQVELLKEKSAAVIDRILERIMDLSGMTEAVNKEAQKSFRLGSRTGVQVPTSS